MDQRLKTRSAKQSTALEEPTTKDEEKESETPPKKKSRSRSRRANSVRADAAMLKKLAEQGNKKKLKDLDFNSEKKKKKQANKLKKAEKAKLAKLAKLALETDSEDNEHPLFGDSMADVSSSNGLKTVTTKRRRHSRASGRSEYQDLGNEGLESEDEEDLMELRDPKRRRSVRLAAQKIKKEEEEKKQKAVDEEEDQGEAADEIVDGVNLTHCGKVLASIRSEKREPGKAISDEALEKLFFAFFPGDTTKFDPNDSLISEIDGMSDGEIARRDAAFRQTMAEIRAFPRRQRRLQALRAMWETEEGREALRKRRWNIRHRNLSKKKRKELEKRRLRRQKELKEKMEEIIPVHQFPEESESGEFRMELTRRQFAFALEILSDLINSEVEPATASHMLNIVELVSDEKLQEALRMMGINVYFGKRFFEEKNALAKIVKELLKKILNNEKITGVFENEENGFQFGTFQAILALSNFYSLENTLLKNLDIKMKSLVQACWNTDRFTTRKADTNAVITYCVADDISMVE